jgi:amino acid transporter
MTGLLHKEWVRTVLLMMFIAGILLVVYAVVNYVSLSYQIGQNIAYQIQTSDQTIDPQTLNEAQSLMAADISLREMVNGRDSMLIYFGAGLMLAALGFLGRDFVNSRVKKQGESAAAPLTGRGESHS